MSSTAVDGGASRGHPPRGPHADLLAVIEPMAAAAGVDLESIEVTTAGRRRVVRIFVDKDGGVSLDEVAELSTAISARLDETDVVGLAPYVLEVSSPGVGRPLTLPRHWRRAVGRLVRVTMIEAGEISGRVVDATDDAVTIDVGAAPRRLSYDEIAKARVDIEFNRPTVADDGGEV